MRTLLHLPLSPASRRIRLALAEKKCDAALETVRSEDEVERLYALNPAGTLPVLIEPEGGPVIVEAGPIAEYLEEVHPEPGLLPGDAAARAEIRRLVSWFETRFHDEVTANLLYERLDATMTAPRPPLEDVDMERIRAGLQAIRPHLSEIGRLADSRGWLAGPELSHADLAAAAQISCLDYLGDVPWRHDAAAKDWYQRIKSRPAFRTLLQDRIPGLPAARAYADLDF